MAIVVEPLTVLAGSKLRSSAVHSYLHVLTGFVTGVLDSLANGFKSVLDTVQSRSKTTLITYGCRETAFLEQLRQVMEDLSTHADSLALGRSTYGTNHELLESDRSIGVSTTVDDVHHRNRQYISVSTADIAIQRDLQIVSSSVSSSEADT